MDAMTQQQDGFETLDSPGGPPWSQDICNPPYASWSLTYDGGANTVGNLTRVVELDGSIATYGYDGLYRMTSEARTGTQAYSISYGYDLAGNITTKDGSAFGTYDDANKMTQIQGVSFSPGPDADGNQRKLQGNGFTPTSGTLVYDSRNKLTSVPYNGPTYNYVYDGFGRRVKRSQSTGTPASRYYIYAGDNVIGEIDDGVPAVAYTWGPDGVASRRLLTGTPNSRFYCYGPQGETRNLTDESQVVTSTYFYEAYGKPKGTVPTERNPFRYGGKFGYYTDAEIQTLQVGARWYSPHLIRWMSRDPIHYRGGDNLGAYVMGNPVRYVDPSGLQATPNIAAPPGVNIGENIKNSETHAKSLFMPMWFREMVQASGPWDYKIQDSYNRKFGQSSAYEDFGNFNYGVCGSAAGFIPDILLQEAGRVQPLPKYELPIDFGFPGPVGRPDLGQPPYGDDRNDQQRIIEGILYYQERKRR